MRGNEPEFSNVASQPWARYTHAWTSQGILASHGDSFCRKLVILQKRDHFPIQLTENALNWNCPSKAEKSPLGKVAPESPPPTMSFLIFSQRSYSWGEGEKWSYPLEVWGHLP